MPLEKRTRQDEAARTTGRNRLPKSDVRCQRNTLVELLQFSEKFREVAAQPTGGKMVVMRNKSLRGHSE